MKKIILLLFFSLITGALLLSQTLVSTDPQPKNAVLEEYTGIHCGYCPDGHAIAAALLANNPGRVVVIAIHQGSFAVPGSGEPDYRTPWGDALAGQAGVTAYPNGTVNRHLFMGGKTAMGRGDWTPSANQIMEETSPVNVGILSEYEEATRELTITVELYYTDNSPESTNYINVALIQSHIFGPQSGGGAGNNYEHMHMLRDLITGQWGDEVTTTTQGTLVERTYTYTVPEDFLDVPVIVEDCDIAVFVTETHQEIYSGDVVEAIGGTNKYIGNVVVTDAFDIKAGTSGETTEFNLQAKSVLDGTEEFIFTLSSDNAPEGWTPSFIIDGVIYTETATISIENQQTKDIQVEVIPDNIAALAIYTMKMESVSNPDAPAKQCDFSIISRVTDLVVNGTGGPEAIDHEYVYLEGLEASGCTSYTSASADIFADGMNADAFAEVNNVYLNIAWTFPALTLDQIAAVETFMDNGGNLLIAGQDIGWDFMSGAGGSHGSPEATEFYEDYLFSNYIDDGSTSNNQFYANGDDEIYGEIPMSAVIDVYGGNMYPEVITAREGASEVFYYDAGHTKNGVVRAATGIFNMIYFGIGLEMLEDVDVKNQIIDLTRNWFDGFVSTEEISLVLKSIQLAQNHPNPVQNVASISLNNLNTDARLVLIDGYGKTVKDEFVAKGSLLINLDVSDLPGGTYFYKLIINDQGSEVKKMMIIR